jgi:hypothetical protein
MKKFIGILIGCTVLICSMVTVSCTENYYIESEKFTDRFFYLQNKNDGSLFQRIIVDKKTGVMYLFHGSRNRGGLTVMVDANGKPLIYDNKQQ